jgi:hypothetical protein
MWARLRHKAVPWLPLVLLRGIAPVSCTDQSDLADFFFPVLPDSERIVFSPSEISSFEETCVCL